MPTHEYENENLIEADFLVVGSGHNSVPYLPAFEGKEAFEGTIIHSHYFRRPDEELFVGKTVGVLGFSFS